MLQQHPKRSQLVAELQEILHLSQRAIYTRLNGKVDFTLTETELLNQYYGLQVEELFSRPQAAPTKQIQTLGEFYSTLLSSWVEQVEQLADKRSAIIHMITNSLPFSLAFRFPDLVKFRLYFMAKHHWLLDKLPRKLDLAAADFSQVPDFCKRISKVYQQFPTTEIWGSNTFVLTIAQLDFLYASGELSHKDFLHLLKELDKLVKLLWKYAESGNKRGKKRSNFLSDEPNFTLYLNEVMVVDEYTLLHWRQQKTMLTFAYHPIFGAVTSPEQQKSIEQYCQLLKKMGTLLSVTNGHYRDTYFKKIRKMIAAKKRKLGNLHTRDNNKNDAA